MPALKRNITQIQSDYEALRKYAQEQPEYITEPLLDRVEFIKQSFDKAIRNNKTGLLKADAYAFFNIQLENGTIIWSDTDEDIICKSLAYDWQSVGKYKDSDDKQLKSNIDKTLSKYGRPTYKANDGRHYGNFELLTNICSQVGLSAPDTITQDTKTQETKIKREKRLEKINDEIRTPSADGTPKLTEKFSDVAPDPRDTVSVTVQQNTEADAVTLPEYHVFEPLTLDGILETPPLDFLTDNLIVRNTVNVFFAPAKTGKTYLCLFYAICMAKGIPFLGMENHLQRNVGYLNLDMFRGGFNDRVKQVIRGFNPNSTHEDIQNILSRLKIIDRESIRSAHGYTPNFFTKDYLDDLKYFIDDNNIEFLIVDTFSRIRAGSKENDNDHMGLTLQNAEEFFSPLECGSLFIHHTGKDGETIRGAQAIIDNSEFVFGLRKVNKSNKHLQLYSDTPRYTDVFELDVYPVFQQNTNEDTGAKFAESYFLTTADPDNENSDIVDFLKAHNNPYMSKTNLAKAVGGNYRDRLKEIDALYAKDILDRIKSGNGFNYKLKSV